MSEHTEDIYTRAQHEKEMTRLEVQCKRWFIAFLVVLGMLFVTNAAWVIYENQFEDVVVTQEVDTGVGDANVSGVGIGDINYGESQADNPGTGETGK